MLNKLTGLEINGAQTFFAAKYIQGDFLSPKKKLELLSDSPVT